MKISSSAFTEGALISKKYTCDGQDISPPLAWSQVPAGAKSLILIVDDPDAPGGTWVHWVVANLPATAQELPEGIPTAPATLESGGWQGANSWRQTGYRGPCPPGGTHRYNFKLYALDMPLALKSGATSKDLTAMMQGHVLAQAQLMGRYQRQK
jgi:Raf kinase inhibitor-like YbhB/YbcL family protein